jgi:hypothetical protein
MWHAAPVSITSSGAAGGRRGARQDCVSGVPHQLLFGCREDVLRKVNGAWKVTRRTIVLDANVLLDENLSVFLQWVRPNITM